MADKFERLSFTKDWNNTSDFPTYEENETQVRADMQLLHDEVKAFINDKLIPGIEGMAVPGAGDMLAAVYDPQGKRQDVYSYADKQAAAAVAAAKNNTDNAVSVYNTTQEEKFGSVNVRLTAAEIALTKALGAITLFKEYRTAGTYTVELPSDTLAVYALVVGAGGGGGKSAGNSYHNYTESRGGGGGAGGNAAFVGPFLPEYITNRQVVVGAGGEEETAGGSSSAFGVGAGGGAGATGREAGKTGTMTIYYRSAGAAGGMGSAGKNGGSTGGVSDTIMAFGPITFSAGGGGGASYISNSSSAKSPAGAGGECFFGKGGDGGACDSDGANGGQCCGGGGAGDGYYYGDSYVDEETGETLLPVIPYKGGKGGDGYVAIWVQRMSGAV